MAVAKHTKNVRTSKKSVVKIPVVNKPKSLQEWFTSSKRWCKEFNALDKNGQLCDENDPSIRQTCLIGGIYKIYTSQKKRVPIVRKVEKYIAKTYYKEQDDWAEITEWNDAPETKFKHIRKLIKDLNI